MSTTSTAPLRCAWLAASFIPALDLVTLGDFGALFLAGQGYEWALLYDEGITASTTFGAPFFTVTGVHGTHVFVGLIWASLVLIHALSGAYSSEREHGVEIFGLYWHFVDVVWVFFYPALYLMGTVVH